MGNGQQTFLKKIGRRVSTTIRDRRTRKRYAAHQHSSAERERFRSEVRLLQHGQVLWQDTGIKLYRPDKDKISDNRQHEVVFGTLTICMVFQSSDTCNTLLKFLI